MALNTHSRPTKSCVRSVIKVEKSVPVRAIQLPLRAPGKVAGLLCAQADEARFRSVHRSPDSLGGRTGPDQIWPHQGSSGSGCTINTTSHSQLEDADEIWNPLLDRNGETVVMQAWHRKRINKACSVMGVARCTGNRPAALKLLSRIEQNTTTDP